MKLPALAHTDLNAFLRQRSTIHKGTATEGFTASLQHTRSGNFFAVVLCLSVLAMLNRGTAFVLDADFLNLQIESSNLMLKYEFCCVFVRASPTLRYGSASLAEAARRRKRSLTLHRQQLFAGCHLVVVELHCPFVESYALRSTVDRAESCNSELLPGLRNCLHPTSSSGMLLEPLSLLELFLADDPSLVVDHQILLRKPALCIGAGTVPHLAVRPSQHFLGHTLRFLRFLHLGAANGFLRFRCTGLGSLSFLGCLGLCGFLRFASGFAGHPSDSTPLGGAGLGGAVDCFGGHCDLVGK